jgi:hypothetical protein
MHDILFEGSGIAPALAPLALHEAEALARRVSAGAVPDGGARSAGPRCRSQAPGAAAAVAP